MKDLKKTITCSLALMALMIMGSTETMAVESSAISQGASREKLFTSKQSAMLLRTLDHLKFAYRTLSSNETPETVYLDWMQNRLDITTLRKRRMFSIMGLDSDIHTLKLNEDAKNFDTMHKNGTLSDEEYKINIKEIQRSRIFHWLGQLTDVNNFIEKVIRDLEGVDSNHNKIFSSINELTINELQEFRSNLKNQYEDNENQIKKFPKFKPDGTFEDDRFKNEDTENESTEDESGSYQNLISNTDERLVDSNNICRSIEKTLKEKIHKIKDFIKNNKHQMRYRSNDYND